MKKIKIELRSIYGNVLFSWESENNTQRETILEALKQKADLRYANLGYADLCSANLGYADLGSANLRSADLRSANLRSANLGSANLGYADLGKVKHNEGTGFFLSQCPTEGAFIAWKKADGFILKLRVTENAKRSSATTLKCRCSEAEVLDIQNIDGTSAGIKEVKSNQDSSFVYKIGEIARVTDFDEDRFNECSKGIHFFISRESAVQY